jgi:hypothetical protein
MAHGTSAGGCWLLLSLSPTPTPTALALFFMPTPTLLILIWRASGATAPVHVVVCRFSLLQQLRNSHLSVFWGCQTS